MPLQPQAEVERVLKGGKVGAWGGAVLEWAARRREELEWLSRASDSWAPAGTARSSSSWGDRRTASASRKL